MFVFKKLRLYVILSTAYIIPRVLYALLFLDFEKTHSYYWELSGNLLQFGQLTKNDLFTTDFEPLYPLFLAGVRYIVHDNAFFVSLIQIFISTAGCLCLYNLACLLSNNKRVGIIAALLYSFYPYLIAQAGAFTVVTPLATLLIVCAYYFYKIMDLKSSIYSGICFGLSILMRSATLPILFLAICALAIKKYFRQALLVSGTALLIAAPMFIRNHQINGSLMLTRNGENLFDGNLEYSDKIIPEYSVDILHYYIVDLIRKERPELIDRAVRDERDRFLTQKAVEFMKAHPWRTIRLRFVNIFYFFHPFIIPLRPMTENARFIWNDANGTFEVLNAGPLRGWKQYLHAVPYTFIFVTAIMGMYLRRDEFRRDFILYSILFAFTAIYSIYFPVTHQRAPMDFILMFYSAYAVNLILERSKTRAWTQT